MATFRKTFSENWHLVSGQRLWLLPTVKVSRHAFEGGRWHVLENPLRGQFFRLHPAAWALVSRLSPDRTVEEAWDAVVATDPESAPTQEETVQLIGQLLSSGLLRGELPPDSRKLLERGQKNRNREWRGKLASITSFRLALVNPDRFLRRLVPLGRWIFSPWGLLAFLAVVLAGGKVAVENWQSLSAGGQDALAPSNLVLLGIVFAVIKIIHEFGHGLACRRYGGEVPEAGVIFMFLAPFPFVDTTSSWGLVERHRRVLVGAAGMLVEIFLAGIAAMVWANTGNALAKALAFNVMFAASVTTVLFNGNPLLRYDAYFMLADWLKVPNLQSRSTKLLGAWCERVLFGVAGSASPAASRRESWILAAYGIVSTVYRTVLFAVLIAFIAGEYLLLGLILALVAAYGMFLKPAGKLLAYLFTCPSLGQHRVRAMTVVFGGFGALLLALGAIPSPRAFRAPGVVQASARADIPAAAAGVLVSLDATSGQRVEKGQTLLTFRNDELAWEIQAAEARIEGIEAERRRAENEQEVDLAPFAEAEAAARRELQILFERRDALVVRAPIAGFWQTEKMEGNAGRWMAQGEKLGQVLGDGPKVFRAVLAESEARDLIQEAGATAEVRFRGDAGRVVPLKSWELLPAYTDTLPSEALGWAAGGPIENSADQPSKSREPFFEVRGELAELPPGLANEGRIGVVRFRVADQPLLRQWITELRRFIQKRYRL